MAGPRIALAVDLYDWHARDLVAPAAQLKLAKGRWVKWIASKAVAIVDRIDRFEPTLRTIALRDRYGTVESDNRRRP